MPPSPPATGPARNERIAIRGDLLDFVAEPAWGETDSAAVRFRPDHWLLAEGGRIVAAQREAPGEGWARHDHRGFLVLPGFVDTHLHSAQIDVIASYGTELLDWLTTYTPGRGTPRRSGARRPRRRTSSMPCRHGRMPRSSSRPSMPLGRRAPQRRRRARMRLKPRRRCEDRKPAPADLVDDVATASARWRR
jgi:hypothetical protein